MIYTYDKINDITSSKVYSLRLQDEINNSSITVTLDRIDTNSNTINIV